MTPGDKTEMDREFIRQVTALSDFYRVNFANKVSNGYIGGSQLFRVTLGTVLQGKRSRIPF